jgi:hypothetical protein
MNLRLKFMTVTLLVLLALMTFSTVVAAAAGMGWSG